MVMEMGDTDRVMVMVMVMEMVCVCVFIPEYGIGELSRFHILGQIHPEYESHHGGEGEDHVIGTLQKNHQLRLHRIKVTVQR